MKKNEDYGLVLSTKENEGQKSARIVGTNYFQLVDFELNPDANVKVQDKIFIGNDSELIKQERSQLSYDDLNKDEEFELEKAVHSIVIANEPKYVKFFNEQSKDASQLHLLDEISRKLGSKILTEKELNGDFESFEDIDKRIRFIESSKDLIVKRVLYEIIELPKIKKGRPAYLFAEDGSDLQYFIKSYDDVYARIAEGRNNRNSDEYRAAGKVMAAKYWTEWFLQGMGGNILYNNETDEITYDNNNVAFSDQYGRLVHYNPDTLEIDKNLEVYQVTNPHNFDATSRYFAYQATMARYGSFIKEAEFNQMATICIPACVDYSTKTLEELSIPAIYTAINDGVWNDIIARSAGIEVPTEPMLVGFWEALDAQLNFEYSHANTLKLS